jgi:hypothetical protein
MLAHVGRVPLEELVVTASGSAAGLLVARGWIIVHLRRRSDPRR